MIQISPLSKSSPHDHLNIEKMKIRIATMSVHGFRRFTGKLDAAPEGKPSPIKLLRRFGPMLET